MNWSDQFPIDTQPDSSQIRAAVANPLWDELCSHIEQTYSLSPSIEYSKCSMARGWNVKYKKGRRAVCTLYPVFPEAGKFTCMVVIGPKEQLRAEALLPSCDPCLAELYANAGGVNSSRWLMIDVSTERILDDVKQLLQIRMSK